MNIKPLIVFILMQSVSAGILAEEFLYPVMITQKQVYVIHQTSIDKIALLAWDPITAMTTPLLAAMYRPAHMCLLPDATGFSFLEYGRVRIKKFDKRSPKTLDFSELINDVNYIQWIDNNSGFCAAKKRDRYGIFHITTSNDCYQIAGSITYDCLYPQKVDSELFYIERSLHENNYHYDIIQQSYPKIVRDVHANFNSDTAQKRMEQLLMQPEKQHSPVLAQNGHIIIDFGDTPIMYLTMLSSTEGFVVEHDTTLDNQAKTITFTYHGIKKTSEGVWESKKLFTFSIPAWLILSHNSSRLYESLLPLLPRTYNQCIYFVDCGGKEDELSIFSYNTSTGFISTELVSDHQQLFFVPLLIGDAFLYGGSAQKDGKDMRSPCTNQEQIYLPTIQLKTT